jgi:ketosteroid isomerase-like protein
MAREDVERRVPGIGALPSDNADVALRAAELFGLRDTDGLCRLMDPNIEWVTLMGSQVEAAIYKGHAGVREYFAVAADAWDSLQLEPDELVEGGDEVVILGTAVGKGRASGAEVRLPVAIHFKLRRGKISYCETCTDQAAALREAGLERQRRTAIH